MLTTIRCTLIAAALAPLALGCGARATPTAMAGAPSPEGDVETADTETGDDNLVTVRLRDLPPPEAVERACTSYVVWITPPGQPTLKAAPLRYVKEEQAGALVIATPYDEFELMVTAETTPAAPAPSPYVVARRSIRRGG